MLTWAVVWDGLPGVDSWLPVIDGAAGFSLDKKMAPRGYRGAILISPGGQNES